jgi:Uma2 family endonuclease
MSAARKRTPSLQEYLALEAAAPTRHEYIDGQVMAMAGASAVHHRLASNLHGLLWQHLRERGCDVDVADALVQAGYDCFYPDLVVVCGEPAYLGDALDTVLNPTVLVEILSPSTSDLDRGYKLRAYTQLPSLREYWIVEQTAPLVTCYVWNGTVWELRHVAGLEKTLHSQTLDVHLAMTDIYNRVTFPASHS